MTLDCQKDFFGDRPLRAAVRATVTDQVLFHGHKLVEVVMATSAEAAAAVVPSIWEEPWGALTA